MPYWFKCRYCHINYDIIGKTESMEADVNFFLRKMNKQIEPPSGKPNQGKTNTTEVTLLYFKTLRPDQIVKMLQIYEFDFVAFGYSYKEFVNLL